MGGVSSLRRRVLRAVPAYRFAEHHPRRRGTPNRASAADASSPDRATGSERRPVSICSSRPFHMRKPQTDMPAARDRGRGRTAARPQRRQVGELGRGRARRRPGVRTDAEMEVPGLIAAGGDRHVAVEQREARRGCKRASKTAPWMQGPKITSRQCVSNTSRKSASNRVLARLDREVLGRRAVEIVLEHGVQLQRATRKVSTRARHPRPRRHARLRPRRGRARRSRSFTRAGNGACSAWSI